MIPTPVLKANEGRCQDRMAGYEFSMSVTAQASCHRPKMANCVYLIVDKKMRRGRETKGMSEMKRRLMARK